MPTRWTGALAHNSLAGSTRNLSVRLFDVTAAAEIDISVFGTGRDADITNMALTALFPVLTLNAGSVYVVQIASPDVYTALTWLSLNLSLSRIGEFPS